jgi:hypothetical protein
MAVIDAHTHIFAPAQIAGRQAICERDATFAEMYADPKAAMADAPALLSELDAAGIDAAVVAGFAFSNERDIEEQNEYILGTAALTPGARFEESGSSPDCVGGGNHGPNCAGKCPRLIPLVSINPALKGWERTLSAAMSGGARGFGELRPHNQGWDPLGADARRFYAAAEEAGAVLLWHVSEPVGHQYAGKGGGIGPAELARVAEAFPHVRMVGAHMGGGLAYFLQMPELRVALANVFFDTAAWPLLYDEKSVARLVDLAGPGRVIFGSDYPLLSPRRQLERIQPLLPPDAVRAVCGETAGSLFRDIRDQ